MTTEHTAQNHSELAKREEFLEWKMKMQMEALAKCDGYPRIFTNAGTTPAERQEYTALTATNRRKWDVASSITIGEIGRHISDSNLLRLWTNTYGTVMTGNPLLVPHVVAICMIAIEAECLRDNEVAKSIVNKELDIALGSFAPDEGFVAYADRVTAARSKCTRLGMPLTDLNTRFFANFRSTASASWMTVVEIWQSGGHPFEEILRQQTTDNRQHESKRRFATQRESRSERSTTTDRQQRESDITHYNTAEWQCKN